MRFELISSRGCPIGTALREVLSLNGGLFLDTSSNTAEKSSLSFDFDFSLHDDLLQVEITEPLTALIHVAREMGIDDIRIILLVETSLNGLKAAKISKAAAEEWLKKHNANAPLASISTHGLWVENLSRAAHTACCDALSNDIAPVSTSVSNITHIPSSPISTTSRTPDIIAVTGGAGFIGSWIVKMLLERGVTVHATVRNIRKISNWGHLQELPFSGQAAMPREIDGARVCGDGRLIIFEADACAIDTEGAKQAIVSLRSAFKGARAVIHTASPYVLSLPSQSPPAIAGVKACLLAAAYECSVQQIALTSSAAAVYVSSRNAADYVYRDSDWSDQTALAAPGFAYHLAKTEAEEEAWHMINGEDSEVTKIRDNAGHARIELTTLCPTQVIGPILGNRLNESMALLAAYADGSKTIIPRKGKCFVDVRDVAEAHVRVLFTENPPQRVLLVGGSLPWEEVCNILRQNLPPLSTAKVPTVLDTTATAASTPAMPQAYNCQVAYKLGVRFRPLSLSIAHAAMSLVEAGILE